MCPVAKPACRCLWSVCFPLWPGQRGISEHDQGYRLLPAASSHPLARLQASRRGSRPRSTAGTSRGTPRLPGGAWVRCPWLPADHPDGFTSGDGPAALPHHRRLSRAAARPPHQPAASGAVLTARSRPPRGLLPLPILLHKPELPLQTCTVAPYRLFVYWRSFAMECEERAIAVRVPHVGQCQNTGRELMGGFVSLCRTAHAASRWFSFPVGTCSIYGGKGKVQHKFGTLWSPEHIIPIILSAAFSQNT